MQYNTVQPESKQDWIKAQSGDTQRRFGDITRWHWGTDMRDPHDMGLTCQWLNVIVQCYWISIKNMHALLHDQSTGKNRSDDSLVLARFWQQPWAIILTTLSWFMTHGLDYSRQICWAVFAQTAGRPAILVPPEALREFLIYLVEPNLTLCDTS